SNVTGSLYQGVEVENDVLPKSSSIARSNSAAPSLFVTLILPVIVRIGFSAGAGSDAAPARFAAASAAAPNSGAASERSVVNNVIGSTSRKRRIVRHRISQGRR